MGVKERRERERTEVREKILDAALEVFASEGDDGVTMRALADAIEYSPPVIYSHFRDKDAIIRELCYRAMRSLAHSFAAIGAIEDPVERLRRIGKSYVDFALENPSHFRFMFLTPHPLPPDAQDDELKGDPQQDAMRFSSRRSKWHSPLDASAPSSPTPRSSRRSVGRRRTVSCRCRT
jgi:AcrR family transcriptional regulator